MGALTFNIQQGTFDIQVLINDQVPADEGSGLARLASARK
jgi:hypothetical protein